ncbi:hypothetical protein GCM10023347_37540 [Streptomyces chumphonensis]|uniref:Integral membrane protein n=1 Tax=Streptomyces chumphonensis TaxID=1214925 RepID=A0A927EWI8_9ACTN|nr:hypothetical protein [Streptomyces chumphonensis]MBD3930710.1 hypothetical protein [Streptomyces chumphonensis]
MPSAGLLSARKGQLYALLALLALYAAQLAGALLPNLPLFVVASAGGLALDLVVQQRQPRLLAVLGRARFDITARQLVRDLLLVVGVARLAEPSTAGEATVVAGLLLAYATHFSCQLVALLVRRDRALPVLTRNVDASQLGLSTAPPRILARQPGRRLLSFMVPATTGLLVTVVTGDMVWGVTGLAATVVAFAAGTGWLARWLLRGRRAPDERTTLDWLDAWLAAYRPTHAMYFSGGSSSAYQANMWLGTLAAVEGRPLIVLRERFMMQKIAATDVPIVCLPKVAHLMALEHSPLKIMIHPANSGKTSQVLRIPSLKHTFVNHGESDKLSSCNPYAKAYDEVWVAGPAARERYQLADIGVDDRDVVEVGRPQLAPIRPLTGPPSGPFLNVLYAPTWEGWTDDPGNTSIMLAGEHLVRALLADPTVRLVYKPHPMTGSVDPRAGEADARIRALIDAANAARAAEPGRDRPGPQAAADLARRTAELNELADAVFRPDADDVERMLVQALPEPGRAEAVGRAQEACEAAFWASVAEWEHQIVDGPLPGLYSCFNTTDLLISDVSSVVSDYLASEKPYAVANTSGLDEEAFRAAFPTVRAATILTPDAAGVPALLAAVRDPARDTLAEARTELKRHLLGPDEPPSLARFDAAVQALCARADARRARQPAGGEESLREDALREETRLRLGESVPGDAEESEDSVTA